MAKLLIIDDDLSLQGVFETAFKNFEVLWAETIDEALKLLKEEAPEVVIVDRYMRGEESGIQMVVEGEVGDASCILLTASRPNSEFRASMLSLGFLYVATKPFSVPEMQAMVNRALSHWLTKKCCNANTKSTSSILSFEQTSLDKLRSAAMAFKVAVGS
jgi:DNA-binding response OmpR family regulator